MAFVINHKVQAEKLVNQLDKIRKESSDSLEKLSSGKVFTAADPRPADRALAEGLEFKMRSLAASKRGMNDAVSLLQTAESGLSEISNIMTRMKEINVAAASTTLSNNERKFLFIEYQALHDEINRIAQTTQFNGIPLLNGHSEKAPESMVFNLDDPHPGDGKGADEENNVNSINFDGMKNVVVTTEGLGLASAAELLKIADDDGAGISVDDARELLAPSDLDGEHSTIYDKAASLLASHRAVFGGIQERINRVIDYNDVFAENIAAAKSKIADTDYAAEVTRLAQNNILLQATTGLLAQNNITSNIALTLIGSVIK
jgi:flagellin